MSCSSRPCVTRASRTPCSSAAPPISHARRRLSRSCAEVATRTTWRPRRASWTPTWCMCTTCCRCPVHAGSRRRARPGRPCSCTSTTSGSSARSAMASRDGEPCLRCHDRRTLPGLASTAAARCPRPRSTPSALARHQPARLRGGRPLRGAEPLRGGPVRAAGRAGGPDRRAAALPARRGVRRSTAGRIRGATRSWRPGSRRRRASTPPSRPLRSPAFLWGGG